MTAIAIAIIFGIVLIIAAFLAPSPRRLSEGERRRRIAVERMCAYVLAADDNPMWCIPPQVTQLAKELTENKELNP